MPSAKDDQNSEVHHNEELNPFVAFRRFADEQMSSLLHNVLGVPSSHPSFSTPNHRHSGDEKCQQEAAERRQRTCEERTREQIIRDEQIQKETKAMLRVLGSWYLPDEEISRCPYRLDDQEGVRRPCRPAVDENPHRNRALRTALVDDLFNTTPPFEPHVPSSLTGATIFGYLLWSPYSPLHLEQDPVLRTHGDKWRRAFEDLTGTRIKEEMPDREMYEKAPLRYWRTMIGGGFGGYESILGPGEMMDGAKTDSEAREDEPTELDLYERFLGTQYPQPTPSSRPADTSDAKATTPQTTPASTPAETPTPTPTPTIMSTLTTTERNTFPDGSVHTKVVLRKRFANGREESTETEHTSYASQADAQSSTKPFVIGEARDASKQEASEGIAQQAKKKGWFWS